MDPLNNSLDNIPPADVVLFTNTPNPVWEEDRSKVKLYLDQLRLSGVTDFSDYLFNHPHEVVHCTGLVHRTNPNDAVFRFFKILPGDNLQFDLKKFYTQDTYAAFRDELVALARGVTRFQIECEFKTVTGEIKNVLMQWAVMTGFENTLERIAVSIVDVSDFKKREQVVLRDKHNLCTILDSLNEGIILTDSLGRIKFMNSIAEKMVGKSLGHVVDMEISSIMVLTDEKNYQRNLIHEAASGCEAIEYSVTVLFTGTDDNGHLMNVRCMPIAETPDTVSGFVVGLRDISQANRFEAEMQRTEHLESIGLLAGGVAHDFNNLLGGIFGYIDIARKTTADERTREYLDKTMKVFDQARKLTQQLLTFTKGGDSVRVLASIAELVRDAVTFSLSGSNIKSHIEIQKSLWACNVDTTQISEVIHNIVLNGMQAMPQGGILTARAENCVVTPDMEFPVKSGNYVRISIVDNGPGIPPHLLTKVFDPFFTTKQNGSGLGLAVSYSIIKKHEGYITVESKVGKGAAFYVYLPADSNAAFYLDRETGEIIRGEGKILIMDDENFILETTSNMLRILGYSVETARDGFAAIELFKRARTDGKPFRVMILDSVIPGGGIGGEKTLAAIKEIDPDISAIISTGYGDDATSQKWEQVGFKAVLNKPYTIYEISSVLYKILNEG